MTILDKVKSILYSKQIVDLEIKLLEMQSAYNKLAKENSNFKNNEIILINKIILLEDNVDKLNITNSSNNKYILQIQEAFQSKIDELKKTSDAFFIL